MTEDLTDQSRTGWLARSWAQFRSGFAPVGHSPGEIFLMRFFFAVVVLLSLPDKGDIGGLATQEHPVGLARIMDVTWIAGSLDSCWWVLVGALTCYVAGLFSWLVLPVAAFVFCAAGALDNSQGVPKHSYQIVGLILLAQSVWYLIAQLRTWRREGISKSVTASFGTHRLAVWAAQQTVVAAYVVTAITKILNSGGQWIKDSKFYPLQIEKTRLSDYYNRLGVPKTNAVDPDSPGFNFFQGISESFVGMLDGVSLWIQDVLVANPNMCRTFLAAGLALELFAFLALRGRLAMFFYGLALIGFHLTIGRVMNLHFTAHNLVILVFMVNLPFIFFWMWGKFTRAPLEKS